MTPRLAFAALACAAWIAAPSAVLAQEPAGDACREERISRENLVDFATAYAAAAPRAKAWRADAVLTKASHTISAPVDDEGRSKRWYLDFLSASAGESATMTIDNGVIRCAWASSPRAIKAPPLSPGFQKDVRRLLVQAAERGGRDYLARGYRPSVELRIGSRRRWFRFTLGDPVRFYWYVTYRHPASRDVLLLTFDANDGSFVASETYKRSL